MIIVVDLDILHKPRRCKDQIKPAGGGASAGHGRRLPPPRGSDALAQQFGEAFRTACAPFQYALRTRAGSEAIVRALQGATEADPRTAVLSIDGVGAYDHISRASMLGALRAHAPLTGLLPFASLFYGQASRYIYYDEEGVGHEALATLEASNILTPSD